MSNDTWTANALADDKAQMTARENLARDQDLSKGISPDYGEGTTPVLDLVKDVLKTGLWRTVWLETVAWGEYEIGDWHSVYEDACVSLGLDSENFSFTTRKDGAHVEIRL
jgi:hypothetical protein